MEKLIFNLIASTLESGGACQYTQHFDLQISSAPDRRI